MTDTTHIAQPSIRDSIVLSTDTLPQSGVYRSKRQSEDTAVFVPRYEEGLAKVCVRPVPDPVRDYPVATLVIPEGIAAEIRPSMFWSNNGISLLLLSVFLLVSLSFRPGIRLITQMFDSLFSVKKQGATYTGVTVTEMRLRLNLQILTLVLEGICLTWAINFLLPENPPIPLFPEILISIGAVMTYYFIQRFLYRVLSWIFTDRSQATAWLNGNVTVHSLLGLGLFPLVFLLVYIPQISLYALISAGIIYLISRIIFIYKGVKIFLRDIYGVLYFILYLCALEIAPLFLLYKGTVLVIISLN